MQEHKLAAAKLKARNDGELLNLERTGGEGHAQIQDQMGVYAELAPAVVLSFSL